MPFLESWKCHCHEGTKFSDFSTQKMLFPKMFELYFFWTDFFFNHIYLNTLDFVVANNKSCQSSQIAEDIWRQDGNLIVAQISENENLHASNVTIGTDKCLSYAFQKKVFFSSYLL